MSEKVKEKIRMFFEREKRLKERKEKLIAMELDHADKTEEDFGIAAGRLATVEGMLAFFEKMTE
jgi:hypothetical protein